MGWRGPCATCRTSLASCPARPAKPTAPPGPVTRAIHRFPGSSHVPGVSPEWRPFPAVKAFLRLTPAAAQGVGSYLLRVFSLSTERRQLSATKDGYPPYCSHVAHRTRIVGCSATKRPRSRRLAGRRPRDAGVSEVGRGARLGTIRQGPLHLWDGGGLARRAAPAWPVARSARQRLPITRARHPRELPVSRLFPRSRSFPRVAPVSGGESICTPEPGGSARGRELFIESFFVVHRAAAVIRNRMRLSTASFTGYPQVARCLPAAGTVLERWMTAVRLPEGASAPRARRRSPQHRRPPRGETF
jgi:hypothetical protein